MLVKVIVVNTAIFLLINIFLVAANFSTAGDFSLAAKIGHGIIDWLKAPSQPMLFITRPWTWFTYMFLQESLGHIFWNMFILYMFGRIFCDMLNDRRFLPTYIFGGLAGLLAFFLMYNLVPKFAGEHYILGASAAVMAVVVSTATYFPDYEVYLFGIFRVKLKWLAVFYVISDFVALRGGSGIASIDNIGGHIAHLGGAAYGFFYGRSLANGSDWSDFFYKITGSFLGLFTPGRKVKVVHRSSVSAEVNKKPSASERQQIIDTILDKISRSGYESLSKEEKEILLKAGEE